MGDRIVGAVLVGDVSEAGPIAMLIRRGVMLSTLKRFDPSRPIRYAEVVLQSGSRIGNPAAAPA
jgi:NAD(P)H-nitrite reductase large subunit